MTNWYDKPYKGSPPKRAIKGFPRALYPPDAEQYGHKPSARGPDVLAYKRTICRLGRWGDWDPYGWDDGYWSEFAHGSEGPDVKTSGVAGVQWQQHLDATGWLGKNTFNALCYALVPEAPGFAHGGEHAMDSVAVDLINEAWGMFAGHEPDEQGGTLRTRALERARKQLGYAESGSNQNKYGDWYGMNGQPWCAIFCTWCFEQEGDSPAFVRGSRYAYVPYVVGDARNGKNGLKTLESPAVQAGDLVCYDWGWDGEYDHIGIFEKWVGPSTFDAIEGNTSTSSNSNGGEVMRRTRTLGQQGTVFVRVAEP